MAHRAFTGGGRAGEGPVRASSSGARFSHAVPGMRLELTEDEARFLAQHLQKHIQRVDDELVHTDARAMQRELAADERRLVLLLQKIESAIRTDGPIGRA